MTPEQRKKQFQRILESFYHQPYEKIYNLISFAELDYIADDSTWMCQQNTFPLRIILVSNRMNKMIWVDHFQNKYSITVKKLDDDNTNLAFDEEFKTEYFKTEEELYEKLKKELYRCLKKRKVDVIENRGVIRKYKTSLEVFPSCYLKEIKNNE